MNPIELLKKHYKEDSELYFILYTHSHSVAQKALEIARIHPEMEIDTRFLEEAALIHDIGINKTNAPEIGCFGTYNYICHGFLGSEMVRNEGFEKHALVCERHTGSGISKESIIQNKLPLPVRDMLPISIEEKLICFADKFFSKTNLNKVKTIDEIRKSLSKYGDESVYRFNEMVKLFLG